MVDIVGSIYLVEEVNFITNVPPSNDSYFTVEGMGKCGSIPKYEKGDKYKGWMGFIY